MFLSITVIDDGVNEVSTQLESGIGTSQVEFDLYTEIVMLDIEILPSTSPGLNEAIVILLFAAI